MNHRPILDRLDHERRTLAQDSETIDPLPSLTRLRATDGSYHEIAWSSLGDDTADAAIAGEIDHHSRLGVPFEWKLYAHDPPPDLLDRLRRFGFNVGPMEAVLILDLHHHDWIRNSAATHLVTRVTTSEQVETYRRVAEAAFDDGDDHADIAASLNQALRAGSTQRHAYIAHDVAGHPVSVGRLYTHPESAFAGLYGGATLSTHRAQGFYRAVVAARARDAIAAGARYLRVDALPTSRPTLERLGFHWLTDTSPCEWHPPLSHIT